MDDFAAMLLAKHRSYEPTVTVSLQAAEPKSLF